MAGVVQDLYHQGQTDYSLEPIVMVDQQGKPIGRISDHDGVIFCCRRGEREIQLTEAFVEPQTGGFPRKAINDLIVRDLDAVSREIQGYSSRFCTCQNKRHIGGSGQ